MDTTTRHIETGSLPHLIDPKVAAALGVGSERNIRRMCEHGEIKAVKVGHRWKINTKALLAQFGLA